MTLTEFLTLSRWAQTIGIHTAADFARYVKTYTDGTVKDVINKLAGCMAYDLRVA